ncbi:MAG: 4Fe-4S binding protein [Methanobrevibacter sp.]|nr:4Fe-4S binding protein [Methanobrevibacter sp.]
MNCLNCTTCESDCQLKEVDTPSLFCMNCQPSEAPCLKECPNNAIEVLGGAITINEEKCDRCKQCMDVCPIGAIHIN